MMASTKVQNFVDTLGPAAAEIGARYGLDPGLILSQSALETGWGDSVAGNNYFGVKSHGQGGGQQVRTHEEINGQWVPVTDSFRQYDSVYDSMEDYAKFLRDNPRYGDVFTRNSALDQIDAVAAAGYATDSRYADKLKSVLGMMDLSAYTGNRLPPIAPPANANPKPNQNLISALMGGATASINNAIGAATGAAKPIMRSAGLTAQNEAPEAIMRAAMSLPGRTAIVKHLMNQNIGKAPVMVSGAQPGGTIGLAVNGQGATPATLMRSASPGGAALAGAHGNTNMDVYRANRAAVGDRITQQSINQTLANGGTMFQAGPDIISILRQGGNASGGSSGPNSTETGNNGGAGRSRGYPLPVAIPEPIMLARLR